MTHHVFVETAGEETLVGYECKSCGDRALIREAPTKGGLIMMDHQIMDALRQSGTTCMKCGGSDLHLVSMTSHFVEEWLKAR